MGYIKLERFLPKNQHTQRKYLNFENWNSSVAYKNQSFTVDYLDFSCKKMCATDFNFGSKSNGRMK